MPITGDVLARTLTQRGSQLAWFLGAGASAAANIPTGGDMIVDFKTRLYCARNNVPRNEVDATDPLWGSRITAFFDGANGLPPAGDPSEYAAAFEAVYPHARDRRSYVAEAIGHGSTSFAHKVLAALITQGDAHCLFTTNFDDVIERTTVTTDELVPADRRARLTVGAIDQVERAERCLRDGDWPLLVKLHGDYQSDRLKNTTTELQTQDARLRALFIEAMHRFGLIVAGYSGRDDSVMDAMEDALTTPGSFPAGLWWVARPGHPLLPRVEQLLAQAASKGIDANVIESHSFDELAGDIEREMDLVEALREHIRAFRPSDVVTPVSLPVDAAQTFPVLRCSALEVTDLPVEARTVQLPKPMSTVAAQIQARETQARVTVASKGRSLIAFGPDEELQRAFANMGGRVEGTARLEPATDSTDLGLTYDAFTRALTRRKPLRPIFRRRGHSLVVRPPDADRHDSGAEAGRTELAALQDAYGSALTGTVQKIKSPFAEGIRIRLEPWDDRWWFVFEPFTWISLPRAEPGSLDASVKDAANDWRRERWAQRYNPRWNSIIDAWAKLLAPSSVTELATHPSGDGVNAHFKLGNVTAWSSPARSINEATP